MSQPASTQAPRDTVEGIELSREELFVMLRLLKARSIPGFDTSWARVDAAGEPTGEAAQLAEAGANALIARGFVAIAPAAGPGEKPRVEVPAPVLALVGACAFSAFTVRVAGIAGDEYREFYAHQFGALGTLHSMPSLNVHLFMPLAGRAGVLKAVASLTGVDGPTAAGGQLGVIPLNALGPALQAARAGNTGGLHGALARAAMTTPGALQDIENALSRDPVVTQLTVGTLGSTGATVERSIFVLGSPAGSFMLPPLPEDTTLLGVFAGDARRVTDWVAAQLPPSAE